MLDEGFRFDCTSHFNQDCIENFFSIIRSKGGWNDRPRAKQFKSVYQNASLLTSIEHTKSNTHCVSESDFTAAISLESCLYLVNEQSNVANNSLFNETKSTHIGIVKPLILIKDFKLQICSENVEQGLCSLASWLI